VIGKVITSGGGFGDSGLKRGERSDGYEHEEVAGVGFDMLCCKYAGSNTGRGGGS
jgi:hypothetical protein